jgi:4a-hydroxytetrahydrobiopterin dehydratase
MRIGRQGSDGARVCRVQAVSAAHQSGSLMETANGGTLAETLNDDEIDTRLKRLAWERQGDEIVREWRFEDFVEAIRFVNRVAEAAEEANHHPDIFVHGWNKVRLSLTNHSAGGLTETDFEMATRFDEL